MPNLTLQHLKQEAAAMMKKIELLEISKRKLLGEGLGTSSIEEIQQVEQQLERSVTKIRARKEKVLAAENARLYEKYAAKPVQVLTQRRETLPPNPESDTSSEVETELFIGLPETRPKSFPSNK
ncbi:hypothetical protein TIFTF001_027000 [Ficus carica]|uniref:K-box domain-containing protein n=1 Tax=Ficus carica TaxID=3494 RepID=A0AA88DM87_FICCA|nr:hypothetical protein TIFTF001_027000 [Ficus carica]